MLPVLSLIKYFLILFVFKLLIVLSLHIFFISKSNEFYSQVTKAPDSFIILRNCDILYVLGLHGKVLIAGSCSCGLCEKSQEAAPC